MEDVNLSREELLAELQLLRHSLTDLLHEKAAYSAQKKLLEKLVVMARTPEREDVLMSTLQDAIDLSADLTGSEKGSMFLLDPVSGKVTDAILSRAQVTAEQRKNLIGNVLDKGLAGWVIRNRQLGLIVDTDYDDRWLTLPNQPYVVRSALGVPILRGEELLGIITLLHSEPNHFSQEAANLMQATADQISLVLENARLYDKLEVYSAALNTELEKGKAIQKNFLPTEIIQLKNWQLAACFYPAKQVAGDFYDIFQLGEYVGLVIADVCDKGVGAALFMALMRSLIRVFSGQTHLRGLSIINLDQELSEDEAAYCKQIQGLQAVELTNNYVAQNHWEMSMFATMFFGVLDPETGLMVYVNGGHEPLYLLDQSGRIKQTLKSTGPAVGMMENMPFRIQQVQFEPGDVLIGYTDGVPEGKDPDGHLFTSPRLIQLIESEPPGSAQTLMDRINTTLFKHIDDAPQFDDITMIAVQCLSLVPPQPQVQPNSMEPITVSGILNSLGVISEYVMNAAKAAGLEKKTSYQLRLAVDEIATNIILHGYEEAGLQGNVKVMADIDQHHLRIMLEDTGVHYDPTKKAPQDDLDLPLEERRIGGLGVYLAMEGVDQFEYERVDDKNRNIFIMNRPQA